MLVTKIFNITSKPIELKKFYTLNPKTDATKTLEKNIDKTMTTGRLWNENVRNGNFCRGLKYYGSEINN